MTHTRNDRARGDVSDAITRLPVSQEMLSYKSNAEPVPCNLCGEDQPERLFIAKDLAYGLPGEFQLVKCRVCGLIYLNPRPAQADIGRYYPATYEPHKSYAAASHPLKKLFWRLWDGYNRCFIKDCTSLWMLEDVPVGRVLEIGCGGGTYLKMLKDRGWETYGTDISAEAVAAARRSGLTVYQGDLLELSLKQHFFDAVVLKHALEHMPDPFATLCAVHRLMSPGGVLLIAVPNIKCWEAKLFGRHWFPLEIPRHLYHFTPETLTALLEKAGFAPDVLSYEFSAEPLCKSLSYVTGRKLEKFLVNYVTYGAFIPPLSAINALRKEGCILVLRARKAQPKPERSEAQ